MKAKWEEKVRLRREVCGGKISLNPQLELLALESRSWAGQEGDYSGISALV